MYVCRRVSSVLCVQVRVCLVVHEIDTSGRRHDNDSDGEVVAVIMDESECLVASFREPKKDKNKNKNNAKLPQN